LEKQSRKEKTRASQKAVNVSQSMVEQHCVDTNDPQSSSQACYTNQSRTLKIPYDLVLGNHETSKGIEEISINYISSGEYMIVVLQLQTYVSQLSLLKTSLMIQIMRPW
jgi:hypothetical protein